MLSRKFTLISFSLLVLLALYLASCGKEESGSRPTSASPGPSERLGAPEAARDAAPPPNIADAVERKRARELGREVERLTQRRPEIFEKRRAPAEASSAKSKPDSRELESERDAFAAIDDAIQQMEKATIAFNTPKAMNRADTVMIQLLLSMSQSTDELSALLKGKGEKESAVVSVAGIMEARLTGANFEITATTPEEQPISRREKTEWRWDVKPKSIGKHDLHLTLTAIFNVGGTQRKRAIRTFDQIITVNVTTGQQLADFVIGNWQWLWAVVAVPLGGAIWQSKRTKHKKGKRPQR